MLKCKTSCIDFFRFFWGKANAESIEIMIDKEGMLVRNIYIGYYKEVRKMSDIYISQANQQALILLLENVNFRSWKNVCENETVDDGIDWELDLMIKGEKTRYFFSGYAVCPEIRKPGCYLDLPSVEFKRFIKKLGYISEISFSF